MTRDFHQAGRSPARSSSVMAATSHPIATATALCVLSSGGNAVDAAIAAALVLGVCEPHMTGIGGDVFAIIAEPDGSLHGVNGSGRSGSGADAALLRAQGLTKLPLRGALPITVPGAVAGFQMMHEKFGALSFADLVAPAIRLAENGHPVGDRVAHDWKDSVADLNKDDGARQHLLKDGKAPLAGETMRYPALAATLKRIAAEGRDGFYKGPVAEDIVATIKAGGGFVTLEDMANCTADFVDPIMADYRGLSVAELPPNGQGMVALIILKLLEKHDLKALDPNGAERIHLEIEAARLAYAMRDRELAAPDAMHCPVETLYDSAMIEAMNARLDPSRRIEPLTLPPLPDSDTIYLAVGDAEGRLVSLIHSVYGEFGSAVVAPTSGVVLQNRGACFTLQEGHPNEMKPNKRPMHTIIPAMALSQGRPVMAFGVMGGAYQPCGHAHVISNMVDYGMNPQAALDFPRAFWDEQGQVTLESRISRDAEWGLAARGHKVVRPHRPLGGGQIVRRDPETGFYTAGSDPRKDGCAAGF